MFGKQDDKLIIFITKLLKETKSGTLHWKKETPPRYLTEGTDDIIQNYFSTEYKNKVLAIFHRRFRQYSGEFDTLYWTGETKMAIVEDENILWENDEYVSAVHDLYKCVKEQVSGLNSLLDDLID